MPARRFFVTGVHAEGDSVVVDGGDAHKIANVLRLRAGDTIEIVDSAGSLFTASLESDDGDRAKLRGLIATPDAARAAIDVAQGIPKGAKMDFVVEKLSELGARALVPLRSERTIVHDLSPAKLARWRRLSHRSAQQSGRRDLLAIEEPLMLAELCKRFPDYDAVLFLWEIAEKAPLRERLPPLVTDARSLLVIVGPEGGFSHAEAEAARSAGAHLVSLGSRILRTETAALAAVALLDYLLG